MSNYILSFRSQPVKPTDTQEAAWGEWFAQIGGGVVDFGNRVGQVSALGNCGNDVDSGSTVLGGYVVIVADDLDSAVTVAKGCPGLQHGGGVEVGEVIPS